jgi:radical SAM superfamily enzyme YgiQ (UPF0313 family)
MKALEKQNSENKILVLNLPGLVLKSGSRWYNKTVTGPATLRYYPYPWFMGYLVSLLKKNGLNTVLIDAVAMEWTEKQTLKFIKKYSPKYIICEPTWNSIVDDKKFLSLIDKKIIKIVVGNYATNFPQECLRKTNADFVVVGEYEFSLLEFFQNKKETLPVNFLSKKKNTFEYPKLINNLDLFPFPERDDTPNQFYNEPSCFGKNMVMVSSRGCRLNCDFCNVASIYGKHCFRTRSAKNVVDEIQELLAKYKFDEIYFDDDNMVSSKEHIEGICREIINRKVKVKWVCMGDGLVEKSTLKLLKIAGCSTYKYGIEHLDKEVLANIPKPISKNRLLEIIEDCKKLKIKSYVNLMIGLPKSTYEKDINMVKEVIKTNPDLIQFSIATPYPGTRFFLNAKKNNWLISDKISLFDATGKPSVSYPNYESDKIMDAFILSKKLWYRHVLFNNQKTLMFFVKSELKRNGFIPTIKKILFYLIKTTK